MQQSNVKVKLDIRIGEGFQGLSRVVRPLPYSDSIRWARKSCPPGASLIDTFNGKNFLSPQVTWNVQCLTWCYTGRPYQVETPSTVLKLIIFEGGKSRVSRYFWDPTGTCSEKCDIGPSGWESNPRPRKSCAMLCQLSYRGRCREQGHEFSIYSGGNAD